MKKYLKKYTVIVTGLMLVSISLVTSCKKGLDYTDTKDINSGNVWNDPVMIKAFLTDIYGKSMPEWSFDGNNSDEATNQVKDMGDFQRGIFGVTNNQVNIDYSNIDKCNTLLDHLAATPASVLDPKLNAQFAAEAKFWRAWAYWGMVSQMGGMPLILHQQNILDLQSLKVPRSKTSVCMAQIIKDLDDAAAALPANYTGNDFGRITSIAALGLKGRILLWYASPLFNPGNDAARWQSAYAATKAAVTAADANGYGLYSNYKDIWYTPNNEMIMVNQYYFPDRYYDFSYIRPAYHKNQPIWSLLTAYPKRDGSPMQADKDQLSDPSYNAQFLKDFYTNRDERFYATVFCGGTPYPTPDILPGQTGKTSLWFAWSSYTTTSKINIASLVTPGVNSVFGELGTIGFLDRKGLDTLVTQSNIAHGIAGAKSYWVPMRYAELLMNYGECANEIGNSNEALNVLYKVRARAKINAGSGSYGITATGQTDIRMAYIKERQVEFAFENMRFPDLRRWRRYDILNNQGARHGLVIVLKPGQSLPLPSDNIRTDPAVRAKFSAVYFDNLDGDPAFTFNLTLNHWFFPLKPSQISLEPENLPQNNEWGGTFDPLQ
ncbi:RagB/SusD family nutrient uptake outer membrane protein [Pedobacter nutrimenti]|uniref:RagB/SusD family nutrient uptake outer membrane protein n=1 Tax=Pedobacter nutrimenti TaxID=1241337 RepID=UPI00292E63F6|nr:RagB/SusD family nutrient uptake outer membrane protein [Pedobacter nutrimenti]